MSFLLINLTNVLASYEIELINNQKNISAFVFKIKSQNILKPEVSCGYYIYVLIINQCGIDLAWFLRWQHIHHISYITLRSYVQLGPMISYVSLYSCPNFGGQSNSARFLSSKSNSFLEKETFNLIKKKTWWDNP